MSASRAVRVLRAIAACVALASCGGGGGGGDLQSSCNATERRAPNHRALCSCIQTVADATLSGSDQRRVAAFFRDPEKAQNTRRSDTARDEAFWDRYEAFAATAEKSCAPRS